MFVNLLLLAGIIVCLAIIVMVLYRKLPHIANVDVDSLRQEKNRNVKNALTEERLKRKISGFGKKAKGAVSPKMRSFISSIQTKADKVKAKQKELDQKKRTSKAKSGGKETAKQHLTRLVEEADKSHAAEDFDTVEEKLMEALSLDKKNVVVYRALAELYERKKEFQQAKETRDYILKLSGKDAAPEDLFASAQVASGLGDYADARTLAKRAVAKEPSNPRFLDLLLEQAILLKDKNLAWDTFGKLKKVNPENKKIEEYDGKIREL